MTKMTMIVVMNYDGNDNNKDDVIQQHFGP